MMANPIAIMQGRLSPPDPRRFQAFPARSWEAEFDRAAALGLDGIEWLFELDDCGANPLSTKDGRARIRRTSADSGTAVPSICADYFMARPLFRGSADERRESLDVLRHLIDAAADVGARTILMPVLEEGALATASERAALVAALAQCAGSDGVTIGLETEMPAHEYRSLVLDCGYPAVRVYYDTGNAAAHGYDTADDIRVLGDLLGGVHLKDRPVGGRTLMLGAGAVDFSRTFTALHERGYGGYLVMQPLFGEAFLEDAASNLRFVRDRLSECAHA